MDVVDRIQGVLTIQEVGVFSSREIAAAVWLGIVIVAGLSRHDIRRAGAGVLRALLAPAIVTVITAMTLYVAGEVVLLDRLGLWQADQLKNTIVWYVTVALVAVFRLNLGSENPYLFKEALADNFKILVVLEFLANVYTAPLWVELLLLPSMTFVVLLAATAELRKEHHSVARLMNGISAFAGLAILVYAAWEIVVRLDDFATARTWRDFYTPVLLSILLMPLLYGISLFAIYERIALRVRHEIPERRLGRYAMWCAFSNFGVNTHLAQRWARDLLHVGPVNRATIKKSIADVKALWRRERSPPDVSPASGWSPYKLKDALKGAGLPTRDYHRSFDEWYAESAYLELGNDLLPNRIAYYVEGDEFAAIRLKLILHINSPQQAGAAVREFVTRARILFAAALDREWPSEVEGWFEPPRAVSASFGGKALSLSKEDYVGGIPGGYSLRFVIEHASVAMS